MTTILTLLLLAAAVCAGGTIAALHLVRRGGAGWLALAVATAGAALGCAGYAFAAAFGAVTVDPVTALIVAAAGMLVIAGGGFAWLVDHKGEAPVALARMADMLDRAAFEQDLARAIAEADAAGTQVAIAAVTVDRFEGIVASYGQRFGDLVLGAIVARLAGAPLTDETFAQFGAAEYAALTRFADRTSMLDMLRRIELACTAPVEIEGVSVDVHAMIGVAIFPQDSRAATTLLDHAVLARHRATADAPVCFYDAPLDAQMREQRALAADLKAAIARGGIDVLYQPQVDMSDGTIIGYEALARWPHPLRGAIPPADFIPIAERHGLIGELGDWVLGRACSEAARWNFPCKVAINVSPQQLGEADLPARIHEALMFSGLPPRRLEIEVTESVIAANRAQALHALRQFKALGVAVALDDFGTGYSSLEVLGSFPFDKIKLDRSFVAKIEGNDQVLGIVRAVLGLGRTFRIPVLAQGIETEAQYRILRAEGCAMGQGYLMGRPGANPMPVVDGPRAAVRSAA
ncbi:putative bifunctional diguanylate cyclase/phosphodiesterase [Sphingomonas immobilis]|uniref:GGDEF domain-containing phosphodiesterase n=1 Tax=Sphingomonas immobilis TaxID=3063997 RepID=A0ABT9A656_9SPHN|nr:GGDEF domain-containing phosphodiesterase [Sphingomonas sp. CA1-15]MDO7844461.1 GGDEF domain-containing phosphodiesterase [Sphingomonas sp. CA1-15]